MSRSITRNTIYSVVRTVCTTIFPLITYPYAARVLLAEGLGRVNFSQSIVAYFLLIAGLGIATYATREGVAVRDDRCKYSRFASEMFSINVCSAIASLLLLALTVLLWPRLRGYEALIAVQSIAIVGSTIGVDWVYTTYEDYGYIAIRSVLVQAISAVLLFTFVKGPGDYIMGMCLLLRLVQSLAKGSLRLY